MPPKRKMTAEDGDGVINKRFRPTYLNHITILAGEDETPFTIHKDIACQRSSFFAAACSSAWTEGRQGIVKVPTIGANTVKLYIHWVYSERIDVDIIDLAPRQTESFKDTAEFAKTSMLFKLYIAADMLLDTAAKNAVMDRLFEHGILTDKQTLNYVWEHTSQDCGLRTFLLDVMACTGGNAAEAKVFCFGMCLEFVHCFLVRLLEQHEQKTSAKEPARKDRRKYHEHDKGASNCK